MIVAYTKTETFFINPRILEEYFDLEENAENLSPETMSELFSEISTSELFDLSEEYNSYNEVTKIWQTSPH